MNTVKQVDGAQVLIIFLKYGRKSRFESKQAPVHLSYHH